LQFFSLSWQVGGRLSAAPSNEERKMALELIDRLKMEHQESAELLNKFEQLNDAFYEGGDINFDALRMMIEYFGHFPDEVHHRAEDLIYDKLQRGSAQDSGADLQHDHAEIEALSERLGQLVELVDLDQEIPRSEIYEPVKDFIARYRTHMAMEEEWFLPKARQVLSNKDLEALALTAAELTPPDRLAHYRGLRQDILDAFAT
jgi:hemerythrin-like domain-containing protein